MLLAFNGVPIANDGTVHLRQRERIYFSYLITLLATGGRATVKVCAVCLTALTEGFDLPGCWGLRLVSITRHERSGRKVGLGSGKRTSSLAFAQNRL